MMRTLKLVSAAMALLVARLSAQYAGVRVVPNVTGDSVDRLRQRQLVGDSVPQNLLVRSSSRLTSRDPGWGFVAPSLHVVENSGLPFSMNEGYLWAGRGFNAQLSGGVFLNAGRLRAVFDPAYVSEQNLAFQVIPYSSDQSRSPWANPYHPPPQSIDLPLRFGDTRQRYLGLGQSSATLSLGAVDVGIGSENLWWGPGIQNALVLSNNAPGFRHVFVEAAHPIRTRYGTFDAQYIMGQLSETRFFDTIRTNNQTAATGLAATWRTAFDTGLTLGAARLVIASQNNGVFRFSDPFNVFRSVGHPVADSTDRSSLWGDQVFSVFARWLLGGNFETHVEWARFDEPYSLIDFLEYPGHSESYTMGAEWAGPLEAKRELDVETELSYVEPDPSLRLRPVTDPYTSRSVPQGFTNQGMTLGAADGPGGSSQWLAGDLVAPRWRFGVYLQRIRWDNGVFTEPIVPVLPAKHPDVTLLGGLRGSLYVGNTQVAMSFSHAARFNYLFQSYVLSPGNLGGVDILNNTLTLTITPAALR